MAADPVKAALTPSPHIWSASLGFTGQGTVNWPTQSGMQAPR